MRYFLIIVQVPKLSDQTILCCDSKFPSTTSIAESIQGFHSLDYRINKNQVIVKFMYEFKSKEDFESFQS